MKKSLIAIALAALLAFGLLACSQDGAQSGSQSSTASKSQSEKSSSKASESSASEQASSSSASASEESASSSSSAASETTGETVIECSLFRLTLPETLARDIEFTQPGDNCIIAKSGDIVLFELACYDTYEKQATEWRHRIYDLGDARDESGAHEVTLTLNYVTADQAHNAHWGDTEANELALEALTRLTEQQLLDSIELRDAAPNAGGSLLGDGWTPCKPTLTSDDAQQFTAESSAAASEPSASSAQPQAPFWGVWIGASQNRDEAEALAAQARAGNWPDAAVYVTSEWSNLNSETWYVVSVQSCETEAEAQAAATRAIEDGYDGAYAKHTGDWRG